ncbi:MAG: hypothetical protein R3C49_27405 [Planctomycetaceae bacterium]
MTGHSVFVKAKVLGVEGRIDENGTGTCVVTIRSEETELWTPLVLYLGYPNAIRLLQDLEQVLRQSEAFQQPETKALPAVPEPIELPYFDEDEDGREFLRVNDWPPF